MCYTGPSTITEGFDDDKLNVEEAEALFARTHPTRKFGRSYAMAQLRDAWRREIEADRQYDEADPGSGK